ncbi:putative casein kinase [Macrophomina phaseolina]|uniref:Casein kinase n=1 Tax=Macrophomina phaseolina TaxID=35725 RepID=A0ABQ8FQW2_9PEZI|nr:putative casein kinase [Macrophomina phaseolina]
MDETFSRCGRESSLKAVLLFADQIISRLEYLRLQSFIHLDTKPENILLETRKRTGHVRTVDLDDREKLACAARYASIRSHLDIEQSRRDGIKSPG